MARGFTELFPDALHPSWDAEHVDKLWLVPPTVDDRSGDTSSHRVRRDATKAGVFPKELVYLISSFSFSKAAFTSCIPAVVPPLSGWCFFAISRKPTLTICSIVLEFAASASSLRSSSLWHCSIFSLELRIRYSR